MTDEELKQIAKMANDLRDLNHLLSILEGVANRLAREINTVITTLEENGGDDIGFDNTSWLIRESE